MSSEASHHQLQKAALFAFPMKGPAKQIMMSGNMTQSRSNPSAQILDDLDFHRALVAAWLACRCFHGVYLA